MNPIAKVLIPHKSWLLEDHGVKLGTLNKEKTGYSFYRRGVKTTLQNLFEVKNIFGSNILQNSIDNVKHAMKIKEPISIYDFPCKESPYNPIFNIRKRLPIYAKSDKSKSLYCAGHYIIKFRKGWVKSFCPKLITLERYQYQGPFKTEIEMKNALLQVNTHHETT
jgi:hypothetical protein